MFYHLSSLLLADPHGLLIIRFKELEVLVGLDGLPAVLAHVKHWLDLGDREVKWYSAIMNSNLSVTRIHFTLRN